MTMMIPAADQYQELREALRDLCGSFDSQYWQKVDEARGYPEAFVDALTKAGWLSALIPTAGEVAAGNSLMRASGMGLRSGRNAKGRRGLGPAGLRLWR